MTEISKELASDRDWIVVELNPERDMLHSLASKLGSEYGRVSFTLPLFDRYVIEHT